jgi:hypothetical protein
MTSFHFQTPHSDQTSSWLCKLLNLAFTHYARIQRFTTPYPDALCFRPFFGILPIYRKTDSDFVILHFANILFHKKREQSHPPNPYPPSRRMLARFARWHPSRHRSGIGDAGRSQK